MLSILDRGFIYGYPLLRGSQELDYDWFHSGTGIKRVTSVTDYVDVADVSVY